MDEVCRFCTMHADTLQHIFAVYDPLDNETPLIHMLQSCSDCEINASDALPQNMCERCVLAVKSAYQFKLKCEESEKYFKDLLGQTDRKPDISELTVGSWCVTESAVGEVHLKSELDQALEVQFKAESNDSDSSENSGESTVERKCYPKHQSNHIKLPICCNICCRWFPTERGYRHHKRTHNELPHRRHKLTHAEELPHRCSSCPLRFWTVKQLKRHLVTHMGERLHKCPHCPKAFTHLGLLKKHSYVHNEDRPFKCPHCPKTFKHNYDVTKHSIVHTGIKLYQCSECDKSFGRIYTLRVHADHLHSSRQVYKCSKCQKTFAKSNMLLRHVKFCTDTGQTGT